MVAVEAYDVLTYFATKNHPATAVNTHIFEDQKNPATDASTSWKKEDLGSSGPNTSKLWVPKTQQATCPEQTT